MAGVYLNHFALKRCSKSIAHNIRNAVTGTYPAYTIDYSLALVSRGALPNATAPAASISGSNVNFTWTSNAGTGSAKATDKAVLVAYCEDMRSAVYTTTGTERSTGSDSLDVSNFGGKRVHTYIGFISEDGRLLAKVFIPVS